MRARSGKRPYNVRMAKKIYPGAAFEPCDNEALPFHFDLFAQISLLAPLPVKAKENLEKCPGAMRLRHFKRGDLICRQGEEDCTAFFILKTEDLETLRQYPAKRAVLAADEQTAAQKKLRDLEAVEAKAIADGKPKDAERAQKQMADLREKMVALEEEIAALPRLGERVRALNVAPEQMALVDSNDPDDALAKILAALRDGDIANKGLEQLEQQAITAGDQAKASEFRRLRLADVRGKRASAEGMADVDVAKKLRDSALASDLRAAATVYLGEPPRTSVPRGGWLNWLPQFFAQERDESFNAPASLPFDGPTEVSSRTRQATLYEGELFGEMACLNRSPRSATVAAARDCYVLEMLSNILTEIDKDPGYQRERTRVYEERVLDLQLRSLSIFADLTDGQFARASLEIRGRLKLRTSKSGEVICDEHEKSDNVYLVRGGLVQVKKNVSSLLSVADVIDWSAFIASLRGDGPTAALRTLLPAPARTILEASAEPSASDRVELINGINELIKNPAISAMADFKDLIARALLHERVRGYTSYHPPRQFDPKELDEVVRSASVREEKKQATAKAEKWSDSDVRRFNRLLLEEVAPKGLRRLTRAAGPDATLTYLSRGEFIGEIGVCKGQPRSSTCIAFGQPRSPKDEDLGEVELVQIPGDVFLHLMDLFPAIKDRVEAEIARRQKRDVERAHAERMAVDATPSAREAEKLGLVQGQKLMLIDMERCTMCMECVKGCVDSHTDGRSRLFLVGHRFEKYMVPITCRSCLDPVCMIGCPVRSIQRGDNHEMVIKDWCVGCRVCAKNCPYDAIKMHDLPAAAAGETAPFRIREEVAAVCDLCSSLPDQMPRCVYSCPHDAAMRVNARLELPVV